MAIAVLTLLALVAASMMKLEPVVSEITCQVHDMKVLMVNIRTLRTEFQDFKDETQAKFDAKQKELDANKKELDAKQKKIDALQTELNDFKNATRTELNATQTDLDAKQRDLDAKQMEIDAMRAEFGVVQTELQDLKNATQTERVAFVARSLSSTSISPGNRAVFTSMVLNSGNDYSSSTGIFTAPVTGTYMFSAQFCTEGDGTDNVIFRFIVNNIVRGASAIADIADNDSYNAVHDLLCSSMTTVVVMQKGQQAWVAIGGSSTSFVVYDNDDHWNMFTGVLIVSN